MPTNDSTRPSQSEQRAAFHAYLDSLDIPAPTRTANGGLRFEIPARPADVARDAMRGVQDAYGAVQKAVTEQAATNPAAP